MKRVALTLGVAGLTVVVLAGAVLGALQLVPWSIERNPAVVQEPAWDSPETRALAERACFDCHSNETRWPWYAEVAPVGWLVVDHVADGREHLNLSRMDLPQEEAHEAGEVVLEGEMPPAYYVLLHPEAQLSAAEKQVLARGLDATLGGEGEGEEGEEHARLGHDDDDDD